MRAEIRLCRLSIWDTFQHTGFSLEFLQRIQLIPKYPIDIKKLKRRCKDIYALTFAMDLRCSRRSDHEKMIIYFSSIWYNIAVDFVALGILVHFLLGRHGWHPSEGEIKTWRTTLHSYIMRRYITYIRVTSHERDHVSNHRQHDCLCMHQLTRKRISLFHRD